MTPQQAFDLYHAAVFRFAYRMTRRTDVAEDVTQECFLAYLQAPGRYDGARGAMRTYLFGIARNLALKAWRVERSEAPMDDAIESLAASAPPAPELPAAVEQAVAELPRLQQEAVILFTYEGFTLEEIAAVSGCDVGTVKSRLHRGRERLKRALAPYRNAGVGTEEDSRWNRMNDR